MDNASSRGTFWQSFSAGIFAGIGGLFGKLSGGVTFTFLVPALVKLLLLASMVVFNTIGCLMFVKGLHGSDSSLMSPVISAATNYFFSALVGSVVFGETNSLIRWLGVSFILMGLYLIWTITFKMPDGTKLSKDKDRDL